METLGIYLNQKSLRVIAGEMEANAHLWRSQAALKPEIPDPMTAIFFSDGEFMGMCVI